MMLGRKIVQSLVLLRTAPQYFISSLTANTMQCHQQLQQLLRILFWGLSIHRRWRSQGRAWPGTWLATWPANHAREWHHWISHSMYYIGYPTVLTLIIIYKTWCATHIFTNSVWVPEEQLGQKRANMLLKCRKSHFRDPRTQKLPWGLCPRPSQQACASCSVVNPLAKFIAMCLCPPKTNGLAAPVYIERVWHILIIGLGIIRVVYLISGPLWPFLRNLGFY